MTPEGARLGAGVSYDEFQAVLDAEFRTERVLAAIGGWQVAWARSAGT